MVLFISASDVVIKGSKTNSFQFKLEKVHPGNINTPPHGTLVTGNSQGEGVVHSYIGISRGFSLDQIKNFCGRYILAFFWNNLSELSTEGQIYTCSEHRHPAQSFLVGNKNIFPWLKK